MRSSIASSTHSWGGRLARSHARTSLRKASCSGVYSKSIQIASSDRLSVEVEGAHRVVPQDLAPARLIDRLTQHRVDTPWKGSVGMRVVGVPEKIVVADKLDRRLHRRLVAAKRNPEAALEVFGRRLGQILVFGVPTVVPML